MTDRIAQLESDVYRLIKRMDTLERWLSKYAAVKRKSIAVELRQIELERDREQTELKRKRIARGLRRPVKSHSTKAKT